MSTDESGDESAAGTDGATTLLASGLPPDDGLGGRVLRGRFVLEEEIGRGGMGVVYQARDLLREEAQDRKSRVAIKVIGSDLRARADALITLQREAKRAQQLAHPNIATVYDFDRDGDLVYLCMELLTGRCLNDVLKATPGEGMPWRNAGPIIRGMAQGLAYAHQRGIVHADFKPSNVFLTGAGEVKILDFGIARVLPNPELTDETRFDGARLRALTPAYASCEMLTRQGADPRDDVFGLACVAYELLAGRHPFNRLPATDAREAGLTPAPIPGLSKRQHRALCHGLAFERDQRTASVQALLAELVDGASGASGSRAARLGLGALTLAAVTAGIVWWLHESGTTLWPGAPSTPAADVVSEPNDAPAPDVRKDPPADAPRPADTPRPVDAATRASIERILEMADLHLAMGRLTTPAGSNAAEAYSAVTELQPGNPLALSGLEAVADQVESLARTQMNEGRPSDALQTVTDGLAWAPQHDGLLRLRQNLGEQAQGHTR